MKILIIGSKGFIGSYCVEFFSKKHKVYECDVVNGYNNDNYYIVVDASNADYAKIFQQLQFDVCINCSGAASVPDSIINPQRDFTLNTVNVFKQLDAIRKFNPTCKYVNISSAAVYGNPQSLPVGESDAKMPVSPYGFHKLQSEILLKEYATLFKLRTLSLRIFSLFGPGQRKLLFWDLYQKAKAGKTIELSGTGNETRDFLFIDDLIELIKFLIYEHPVDGSAVNAASGVETKISEVAKLFISMINPGLKVSFNGTNRTGDPLYWKADVSKIRQMGFKPKYTLESGLKKYINWIKTI